MRVLAFALLSGGLTLLSACGGGRADAPPLASNRVPASALVSATAFTSYVGSLPASEQADPLGLDGVLPPTSDTDPPAAI
jgi:hypothetical protein